jgi:hypothetical protein
VHYFNYFERRNKMDKKLTMKLLNDKYGVCRLEKEEPIPAWAYEGEFFSITKTEDELSILCLQEQIPDGIKFEGDWRILKVLGPLDFSLIGILSKISSILASHSISIFAVSTYDTDYILLKEGSLDEAVEALRREGYEIII